MKIRELRKKAGLTQNELAEKTGVSLMSIRRYETGERLANFELLMEICKVLGVSLAELVGEENMGDYAQFIRDELKKDHFDSVRKENGDIDLTAELIDSFIRLNYQGQEKAIWFVELLSKLPEYLKPEDELIKINKEDL